MAGNNLNQIVLDAFRQANGNTGGSDVQTLVHDLLPPKRGQLLLGAGGRIRGRSMR